MQPFHSIKVVLRTTRNELDIRRIQVQDVNYEELVEILQQMFQLETTEGLCIQYMDLEGDTCNITNKLELDEAFNAKFGEFLKLELSFRPQMLTGELNLAENTPHDGISICSDIAEIQVAIADSFDHISKTINRIIENLEKNAEKFKDVLPNPKVVLELLKPIVESFLNDPKAFVKKPFQSFLNDLDEWLAEIDLLMHQKPQQKEEITPESNDQPNTDSFNLFRDIYEKFMNETKKILSGLDQWIAEIDLLMHSNPQQKEEIIPESSNQPFADSFIRPFKELYENVISEVEIVTERQAEEPQLFEQQMQELKKMGFLNEDQNLAILIQTNGDLLRAVIGLLEPKKT